MPPSVSCLAFCYDFCLDILPAVLRLLLRSPMAYAKYDLLRASHVNLRLQHDWALESNTAEPSYPARSRLGGSSSLLIGAQSIPIKPVRLQNNDGGFRVRISLNGHRLLVFCTEADCRTSGLHSGMRSLCLLH